MAPSGSSRIAMSVLDQSPIATGRSAHDALEETLALAQHCDQLGYRRYWLAEHHNTPSLAGSAPEVLIARVASITSHIRVGSGGVMLSHYSPLKVAETFRVLHALFPGRIDLGIGRAPGSDRRTAAALAHGAPLALEQFPEQLRDLEAYLTDAVPPDHPFSGVHATPRLEGAPEIWLLGSSGESAAYAAHFGFAFSFAHFINRHGSVNVLNGYRAAFQPSPSLAAPAANLAVRVICAASDEEARRLASSFGLSRLRFERGDLAPLPSVKEAQAYQYNPIERAKLESIYEGMVIGSPATCRSQLETMAAEHGVDELVILTLVHDAAARRRSYALLAEVFGSRDEGRE